ncbi:MAG: hypothetical protein M1821_003220 [Bathelium mastoideum]|nr:MAG: hypothetical protein M1821_003220 [Bathelium mastoideum]KAI9689426.1 MAG: hypothetical protein M1822_010077 [Bathelium mastoideum]
MGDVPISTPSNSQNLTIAQGSNNQLSALMDHLSLMPKVSFVRSSSSSLRRIANLDKNKSLVLFTPAVALTGGQAAPEETAARQDSVDPFEIFGRRLAEHHKFIRHVPYLPNVGMTETHAAFAENAGAIVIVMWASAKSSQPFLASTATQRAFADAIRNRASSQGKTIPILLLVTGTSQPTITERDLGNQFQYYDNILHSQIYNQTTSRLVVDILFQRH